MKSNSPYSIGIDLGTTNCALAFQDHASGKQNSPQTFDIAQIIAPQTHREQKGLASFVYQPLPQELENQLFALPWEAQSSHVVGEFARTQSEKLPQRVVNSAKSWLCAQGDRKAANLPLAATDDVDKMSPVQACALYLKHLKQAWNHANQSSQLSDQQVVLTVPASFDIVARNLTQEAAAAAGIAQVTLLEEPIAAFYAWIAEQGDGWRKAVEVGDVVLVCDIGGGTTDFSLIAVEEHQGELSLRRIAVGDHILLGGDNMDLALARHVQLKLQQEGKKIAQWQFWGLAHSCRKAKETLLNDQTLQEVPVMVPSRGSKLMGGTLKTQLSREDLNQVLLEGFFAPCESSDSPRVAQRSGLRTYGLDYASDPSILKHLAKFLKQAQQYVEEDTTLSTDASLEFLAPTAILFNGGVSKAALFRERIVQTVNSWLKEQNRDGLKILQANDPDLAVSLGAAYYGSVQRGSGLRIKSQSLFSYYIGVESSMPAIPGMPPLLNGLCVLPAGIEEGTELKIQHNEFGLVVGETVMFRFFMAKDRPNDQAGTIIEEVENELEELAPLEITLPADQGVAEGQQVIPVTLSTRFTELGALELFCDASQGQGRWKLEFNLRDSQQYS